MFFIILNQVGAKEELTLSQEAFVDAVEQAVKLQKEASKIINENLANNSFAYNFFGNSHAQKGCPSQGLEGKNNTNKSCITNVTPPIPQRASTERVEAQKENADQDLVPAKIKILVFVSFSMPAASLKGLAQQTQQHNAVLVIRGLYQDSFVKTAQKLQELGIAVDIHPELFETHHVSSVPTFVLVRNGHAVLSLKGNVTLSFVAKEFDNHIPKDQPNFRRVP